VFHFVPEILFHVYPLFFKMIMSLSVLLTVSFKLCPCFLHKK
jgi:hypothetical protein